MIMNFPRQMRPVNMVLLLVEHQTDTLTEKEKMLIDAFRGMKLDPSIENPDDLERILKRGIKREDTASKPSLADRYSHIEHIRAPIRTDGMSASYHFPKLPIF